MMKIIITENQLKKIIIEQDDTYNSFVRGNKFRNCRGVALKLLGVDSGTGGTIKVRDNWDEITNTKYNSELKEYYKDFVKSSGIKIDFEYYLGLRHFHTGLKNNNGSGNYEYMFNDEGKPFTSEVTQRVVNRIEELLVQGYSWFFYLRDVYGKKTPNMVEFYQYIESVGGKDGLKKMVDNGFSANVYKDKLSKNVESYNVKLIGMFPFKKPAGQTEFYIAWEENGVQKVRYFNTFEEWKFSVEALKVDGNTYNSTNENALATEGSALYSNKPTGESAEKLLK